MVDLDLVLRMLMVVWCILSVVFTFLFPYFCCSHVQDYLCVWLTIQSHLILTLRKKEFYFSDVYFLCFSEMNPYSWSEGYFASHFTLLNIQLSFRWAIIFHHIDFNDTFNYASVLYYIRITSTTSERIWQHLNFLISIPLNWLLGNV